MPYLLDLLNYGPLFSLFLTLLMLGMGPLAFALGQRWPWVFALLDGFVLASVSLLVILYMLPEVFHEGGLLAVGLTLLGYAIPRSLEHGHGRRGQGLRWLSWAAVLLGLTAHAVIDGVALAGVQDGHGHSAMGLAVALHRLPVALAIWWFVRPRWGRRAGGVALGLLGVATGVGFLWGGAQWQTFGTLAHGVFQAFVAGALLHVVGHRSAPRMGEFNGARLMEGVGLMLGAGVLFLLPDYHAHGADNPVTHHLVGVTMAVAPWVLLSLVGWALLRLPRFHRQGIGGLGFLYPDGVGFLLAFWLMGWPFALGMVVLRLALRGLGQSGPSEVLLESNASSSRRGLERGAASVLVAIVLGALLEELGIPAGVWAIGTAVLLAAPLGWDGLGAVVVAYGLVLMGWGEGAAMAFALLAPHGPLRRLPRGRPWALIGLWAGGALLGFGWQLGVDAHWILTDLRPLGQGAVWEVGAAWAFLLLCGGVILRVGPHRLFERLWAPGTAQS